MGDTPGHTVQNGRGGKAETPDELPVELHRLVKLHHPDLIEDPRGSWRDKPRSRGFFPETLARFGEVCLPNPYLIS